MKYHTITLISRSIDCSNISENEFVMSMFNDIIAAEEQYNEIYIPEWVTNKFKNYELYINSCRNKAIKYAEDKWKTEKKRIEYVNNEVAKARHNYKFNNFYDEIGFFDFDVNPGSIGISCNCTISIDRLTFSSLRRCFNEIKNNEYFMKAKGWKLEYEAQENSYRNAFRPHIKLILDDEIQDKMNKDKENLTKAVTDFYEGCTYFGD